jgi:hypothetical protein
MKLSSLAVCHEEEARKKKECEQASMGESSSVRAGENEGESEKAGSSVRARENEGESEKAGGGMRGASTATSFNHQVQLVMMLAKCHRK